MTEPTYTYIKGQGWVVINGQIVKDKEGRDILYEFRMPQTGEPWFKVSKISKSDYSFGIPWVVDGKVNHVAVAQHVGTYRIRQFSTWLEFNKYDDELWFYIALIPL